MRSGGKIILLFLLIASASATLSIWYIQQKNTRETFEAAPIEKKQPIISLNQPTVLVSDPQLGNPNGELTIIEFADFRCFHCKKIALDLNEIISKYPKKIRLVWKDFPSIPPQAESFKAHIAGRCAHLQGKFWEYHDNLFHNQNTLSEAQYIASAREINLDLEKFQACITNESTKPLVERSFAEGQNLKIDGTPTIFVNGEKWEKPIMEISSLIK